MKENQYIEFKSRFSDAVIETLSAFASNKGGKVYVGVDDEGKPVPGFKIGKETLQQWLNEIKNKTKPSIFPDIEPVEFKGKTAVEISIQEYPIKPVSFKGRYYKRVKNSNHQLSLSEISDLHLKSFNSSWDYQLSNDFELDTISLDIVENTIKRLNARAFNIQDDPFTFLVKSDLIREGKLTRAAYLLFVNKPSVFTTIELGRFQTETIIKDSQRSQDGLIVQVDRVMDFVKKHINKEIVISGKAENEERWQYPLEALREIILNMIVHRDYSSPSDSIVKVFDHKIEFYNPGRLPHTISVEDLLSNRYKSTPRNKLVADMFKNMGMIEKYGSGIRRILDQFKDMGLPAPTFENQGEGFLVTVFGEKFTDKVTDKVTDRVTDRVTDNQREILLIFEKNSKVTTNELAKQIGISQRKIKENIAKLKALGVVKRIGPAKGGYWKIIDRKENKGD